MVCRPRRKAMSQTSLTELLRLTSAPVAITFVDAAPPGVPHVSAVEPSGCGYWRRAAAGEVFFTVADDHKRCLVGAPPRARRRHADGVGRRAGPIIRSPSPSFPLPPSPPHR